MEIVAGALEWATTDEENLSRFLDTETGKRFLPHLLESVPQLLESGHVNAILIRSGEVRAWQSAARTILEMAHPPIAKDALAGPSVGYASLTDDSQWNDGQKLTPEPEKKNE